jgi:hypothetical protein
MTLSCTTGSKAFLFFEGSHTGAAIAERLDRSLDKMNLEPRVAIYATSDNASNAICAMENSNYVNEHFRCVCHTMQLCIHDTFQNIDGMQNAVKKCQKISAHTHHSPLACQSLKNECKKLSVPFKKLITVCATRLNSELMNMKSVLEVKDVIMSLTRLKDFHDLAPTPREWEMISGGVQILEKFKITSERWSADLHPTLQLIVPGMLFTKK